MANGTFGGGDGSQGNPFLIEDDLDAVTYFSTIYKFESYAILVNNVSSYRALGIAGNLDPEFVSYYNKYFDLNGYTYEILRELNGALNLIYGISRMDFETFAIIYDSVGTGYFKLYYNINNGNEYVSSEYSIVQLDSSFDTRIMVKFIGCNILLSNIGSPELTDSVSSTTTRGWVDVSNGYDNQYYFEGCTINVNIGADIKIQKSKSTRIKVDAFSISECNKCYILISGGVNAISDTDFDMEVDMDLGDNCIINVESLTITGRDTWNYSGTSYGRVIINIQNYSYIEGSISYDYNSTYDKRKTINRVRINASGNNNYVNTYISAVGTFSSSSLYVNRDKIFMLGEGEGTDDYFYSDSEMKNRDTFTTFKFADVYKDGVWGIDPAINGGYPYFIWYTYPTAKIGLFVQGKLGIVEIPTYSLSEVSGECIKFNSGKEVRAIKLVATTDSNALPIRIKTSKGIMSLSK